MGITLEEYAAAHPVSNTADRGAPFDAGRTWQDRQQEIKQAKTLQTSVIDQLRKGNDPQLILYTAIECIGLYAADPAFIEQATAFIDNVYSDLMQQSIIESNEAIAAQRLHDMQTNYSANLRRSINKQLAGYRKIAAALNEALNNLDSLENADKNN